MRAPFIPVVAVAALLAAPPTSAEVLFVPGQVATLSQAISQVADGGVIEMAAGTYPTPVGGWFYGNLQKSFTVRAAAGATVILDGSGLRPVFRLQNTTSTLGGQVTFEGLIFANGRSTQDGVAGGVSVEDNDAVFIDCEFRNNGSDASITGGGGAIVFGDADVRFLGCRFFSNWARNEGGGLKIGQSSRVVVHDSIFADNRVNLAGHRPSSAGGAIHVGNGDLMVSNTRFDGNEAGFVGGGLYVIGSWQDPVSVPRATVDVANSTFIDNVAEPYPGVNPPSKTEGGALHAEDQTVVRIDFSRFITNRAETGGGLNLYRARVEVANSVFRGNRATAVGANTGFGGAIAALSNDTSADGSNNRPSAELTVSDTLIQGSYQQIGSVAQIAGGIFATGDQNRQFGQNGVPAAPNLNANRARIDLQRVVISDCTVIQSVVGTGTGGGANFGLAAATIGESLVLASEATGTTSQGGGLRAIGQSLLTVTDSTLAVNQAQRFGGGVHVQGAEVRIDRCALIENTDGDDLFGAAVFSAPDEATGISVTGHVADSVISNTADRGLLLFDDDRQGSPTTPYNDLRYNGNTIFDRSQGTDVYRDPIAGAAMTVGELNSLVVNRIGGTPSTDKVQVNNSGPSTAPVVASIAATPARVLPSGAAGDPAGATAAFVGYAWSGGSATLNGSPVSGFAGVTQVGTGTHVLSVGGSQDSALVGAGQQPSVLLSADPVAITSGQQSLLSWTTSGGTFLGAVLDHGVAIPSTASGAVAVSPAATTTYHLFVLTEEGGATSSVTVYVDEAAGLIFSDGFESGTTAAWGTTIP